MTENKFPTEIVELASRGWFYDKDNLLSSGVIELQYMTAMHEDILTSTNLIQKGVVIERLLQALIVDKKVSYDSLLIGDKNSIMVASRILGYGKDYIVKVTCANCGTVNNTTVDLTQLDFKTIPEPAEKNVNLFTFTLPTSNRVLTYRLLTQADEDSIDEDVEKQLVIDSDVDKTLTTRLKYIIVSVDGDESKVVIRKFVDSEFLARDSRAFRQHYQENSPDVDFTIMHKCKKCSDERKIRVPIGPDFFWPDSAI